MKVEVKPLFEVKTSDLPVLVATTLHHSLTGGFLNAGNLAWAGRRGQTALSRRCYLRTKLLQCGLRCAIRNARGHQRCWEMSVLPSPWTVKLQFGFLLGLQAVPAVVGML